MQVHTLVEAQIATGYKAAAQIYAIAHACMDASVHSKLSKGVLAPAVCH